ncbi:hypothetical protein [Selenomonas bovis]|uniref:hypothetical protein n=1 Tax=Selenomonas bovis TaxID=416586 RepID=UPI003D00D335
MAERLPLGEVLRAVLAEDRTLLARREDLLAAMEQRVTPGLMRDYRSFQKAVQSSTVGELFLTADGTSIEAQGNIRIQVMKILRNLGMQTRAAYRVEETFAQALGWPSVSTQVYQAMMRNDDSARHSSQESWQMEELLQRVAALKEENHALREMQTRLQQKVETLERKCDERNQQVKDLERRLENLERAYEKQQDHLIKQEFSHGLADKLPQEKSLVRTPVAAPGSRAPGHASPPQQDSGGKPAGVPMRNVEPFPVYGGAGLGRERIAATGARLQNQQPAPWQPLASAPMQSTAATVGPGSVRYFVARYNALPSEDGLADREARWRYLKEACDREERWRFLQVFSVQGFFCANSEERMSNPKVSPRYEEAEVAVLMRADYWAKHVQDDLYAVAPNAKLIYDSAHHAAGGMMEAFDSNFAPGHTYRQIRVETSAYFLKRGGRWSVAKKGLLRLSE